MSQWRKSSHSTNTNCVQWRKSSRSSYNGNCLEWHKSCYSTANGQCVEVRGCEVRDSKDREGPTLLFTTGAWDAFIAGIKAGELTA